MAWWVWSLIAWATVASAAALWFGAERSSYYELKELHAARRADLWDNDLFGVGHEAHAEPVHTFTDHARRTVGQLQRTSRQTVTALRR